MQKKRLIILGNYGGVNLGDELILSGLLAVIPKSRYHITIVSSNPQKTKQQYNIDAVFFPPFGIRSLLRLQWLATVKHLQQADLVIFGGGGLFQDREPKAIWLWSYYRLFASFFAKRIIFVGQSVGPVQRFFSRFLIKRAFQNISFVSLRDTESALQLQKAGIKNKNIVQTTDAVFLLPKKRSVKKRGTLLMLRGDANVAPDLINHIIPLLPKPVRCVAMDAVDASYCYKLDCRQLEIADADQLINTVANTKFVVSGRLHGGLAALSQNTSMLMFASAPKICNFFSERELGDLVCDEAISKAALTKKINTLKKNFSKTEKRLASALTQEKKIAKDILPYFLQKR